ncbi:MAG: hypothetical protein ACFHWZ_16950 [Phycisphaerales bacterium]
MGQIDHPNPDEKDCRLWRVLTIGLVIAIAYTFVQKMIEYWMSPNVVWPSALGRVGRGVVRRTDDMSLLDSLLLLSVLVVLSTAIVIRETRYWLHIRRRSFIVAVPASIYLLVVYFADICDPNHLGQFCWDCQTHWGESGTTRCAINKVLQTIEGIGSVFGYGCYALVLGAVVPSAWQHIRKPHEYASAVVLARLSNIGLVALLVLVLFITWIFARELVIALMDSVTSATTTASE